jgi:hypothetical protein
MPMRINVVYMRSIPFLLSGEAVEKLWQNGSSRRFSVVKLALLV